MAGAERVLPWWLRAVDEADAWLERRGILRPAPLGPTALLAAAEVPDLAALELPTGWAVGPALGRLCTALEAAPLSWTGRRRMRAELVGALRTRHRMAELLRARPEIARTPMRPPVVIAGLPRTGTTLLHALLCAAVDSRGPLFWEMQRPVPPPSEQEAERSRAEVQAELDAAGRIVPGLRQVHELRAGAPEECVFLLRHSLASSLFHLHVALPDYLRWLIDQPDPAGPYRELRLQLQLLQQGRPARQWILKSPHHQLFLEPLREVFPGAPILLTHRALEPVAASGCSLYERVRRVHQRGVDPRAVGADWLGLWTEAAQRARRARERLEAPAILDIAYEQLLSDPVGMVLGLRERLGLPEDPELPRSIRRWLRDHPRGRHGPHRYDLARYGLQPEQLRGLSQDARG